jgi:hypothetical protein
MNFFIKNTEYNSAYQATFKNINDLKDFLQPVKDKMESPETGIYCILGWILVILTGVMIVAFLYRCFRALMGKEILIAEGLDRIWYKG